MVVYSRMVLSSPISTAVSSPPISQVLGRFADGGKLVNAVAAADPGPAADHYMRPDPRSVADGCVPRNDREGPDSDVVADVRARLDDCARVDQETQPPADRRIGSG
jgi:hypothetical protein